MRNSKGIHRIFPFPIIKEQEKIEEKYKDYITDRNIGYILFIAKFDGNIITRYLIIMMQGSKGQNTRPFQNGRVVL